MFMIKILLLICLQKKTVQFWILFQLIWAISKFIVKRKIPFTPYRVPSPSVCAYMTQSVTCPPMYMSRIYCALVSMPTQGVLKNPTCKLSMTGTKKLPISNLELLWRGFGRFAPNHWALHALLGANVCLVTKIIFW